MKLQDFLPVRCGKFSTGIAEVNGKKIAYNLKKKESRMELLRSAFLMQSFFFVVDFRIVLM